MAASQELRGKAVRRGWHGSEVSAVASELGVDPAQGLSAAEAASRLRSHGPNRLAGVKQESGFQTFVRQYRDGQTVEADAEALVPGEVVLVEAGNRKGTDPVPGGGGGRTQPRPNGQPASPSRPA